MRSLALCFATVLISVGMITAIAQPADEPKPVSAIILAQCGKIVGVVAVDEHGGLHPVPPEAMTDEVLGEILQAVGENHIVATVPCKVAGQLET